MKELSGGDTIMARGLFKDPIEFRPMFKLLLLCNALPNVPTDDGGTWRRIRVVEFTSKFVEDPKLENEFKIDYNLQDKIEKWPEHFMALLLNVYKSYKEEGIIEPSDVLKCTNEYKSQNNHIALYLMNCIEEKEKEFLSLDEMYIHFKSWIKEDGIPVIRVPSKPEVTTYMVKNGYKKSIFGGVQGFKGYRIKSELLDDSIDT